MRPSPAIAKTSAMPELQRGRRPATAATVFGLDVCCEVALSFLQRARARASGRTLEAYPREEVCADFSSRQLAREICVQRRPDGSAYFRIQAHPHAGYLIWGEGRGSYRLSGNGGRLVFATEGAPARRWERFLVGQVLPFAALLSGLEIFHASAVLIGGRAVAFVGPSGAGKTSLALELGRRGAGFLADDVLAVDGTGGRLMAQPGAPVAALDPGERRRLRAAGVQARGEVLAEEAREQLVRVEGALYPAPLAGLFFLDRRTRDSRALRFAPAADPRLLLGSTFNFVLDTPRRMRGLLDVCALAARGRVERIVIGPSVDAGELAQAVMSRMSEPR